MESLGEWTEFAKVYVHRCWRVQNPEQRSTAISQKRHSDHDGVLIHPHVYCIVIARRTWSVTTSLVETVVPKLVATCGEETLSRQRARKEEATLVRQHFDGSPLPLLTGPRSGVLFCEEPTVAGRRMRFTSLRR